MYRCHCNYDKFINDISNYYKCHEQCNNDRY